MKVVTEEHYIPEKRYTTSKYIASDGVEFSTECDCLRHEEYLEVINHPVFKSCIENVFTYGDEYLADLYYISSEDDYKFLLEHLGLMRSIRCRSDFYKYNSGWYLYWSESGGDNPDEHYLLNYNAYVEEIEDSIKDWKTSIQSKLFEFEHKGKFREVIK